MFSGGLRQREYSAANDPLPTSGRLIAEFVGRRNIRDMFAHKPSLQKSQSKFIARADLGNPEVNGNISMSEGSKSVSQNAEVGPSILPVTSKSSSTAALKKRSSAETSSLSTRGLKRSKSTTSPAVSPLPNKGQKSLKGFFTPRVAPSTDVASVFDESKSLQAIDSHEIQPGLNEPTAVETMQKEVQLETAKHMFGSPSTALSTQNDTNDGCFKDGDDSRGSSPSYACPPIMPGPESTHDAIETRESWSKLFTKPVAPKCEGHEEPCIALLTKKPGMNMGRSFWMCRRPLGPSGAKEKNTQWRCQTFIWCSDWNSNSVNSS